MTHDELVARAERWLRNTMKCGVVLTEFHSWAREIPDAFGLATGNGYCLNSYLVECKVSIDDFYSDSKKPGRKRGRGIGRFRYYMTPPGLLDIERVKRNRPRWGLLECKPRTVRIVLKAESFSPYTTAWKESPICYSYMRRIAQYGLSIDEAQEAVRKEAESRRDDS
jgi:hypothetical protein